MPKAETAFVRGALGRVLFSGDDVTKKVGAPGGEAARLVFCRIMVPEAERPHPRRADQPPRSRGDRRALSAALKKFEEGTVVFVSHDRAFVAALATRILEVTPNGFRDFPGTYDEYLARCGDDHLDADAVVLKSEAVKAGAREVEESANRMKHRSREEQKRRANRKKQLPAKRDAAMAAIEAAEARKAEIHAKAGAKRGYYEKTPRRPTSRSSRTKRRSLGPEDRRACMADWEALEAEIAAAETT